MIQKDETPSVQSGTPARATPDIAPAPWLVSRVTQDGKGGSETWFVIDRAGGTLAGPFYRPETARLIAAAPAMRDALFWITRAAMVVGPHGIELYAISAEHMEVARSALQAGGGS